MTRDEKTDPAEAIGAAKEPSIYSLEEQEYDRALLRSSLRSLGRLIRARRKPSSGDGTHDGEAGS